MKYKVQTLNRRSNKPERWLSSSHWNSLEIAMKNMAQSAEANPNLMHRVVIEHVTEIVVMEELEDLL